MVGCTYKTMAKAEYEIRKIFGDRAKRLARVLERQTHVGGGTVKFTLSCLVLCVFHLALDLVT